MVKRARGGSPPPSSKTRGSRGSVPGMRRGPSGPVNTSLPRSRTLPGWLNETQRRLVEELNTQLLHGMLRHAEAVKQRGIIHPRIRILERLGDLDVAARIRLAKLPFVLLDAGFTNGEMWFAEHLGQSAITMEDSLWLDGYDLHVLARSLFTYAWHFTRHHADAARIVFGMSKQTSDLFASLSLRDLERVILQRGHWVRPRWEHQPDRWDKLLERARTGDSAVLDQRALQLLYGDLFEELR